MKKFAPSLEIDAYTNGQNRDWRAGDFYVTEQYIHDLLRYYPMRVNCYMLAICISGHVTIAVNGEKVTYEADSFAAYSPPSVYEVLDVSEDYRCRIVVFKKEFLVKGQINADFLKRYQLLSYGGITYIKFDKEEACLVNDHLVSLRKRMEQVEHIYRESIVRNLILNLLNDLEYIYSLKKPDNHIVGQKLGQDKLLGAFHKLLEQSVYKTHTAYLYAAQLNVTPRYLNEVLKETTGKTTKEYIDDLLLSEAKVLLQSGKYNVSEVATILCYESLEVFCRFFKKKTNINPLSYMKNRFPVSR